MNTLLLLLDLLGTFVFALSGAIAGVNRRLDLFGVLVLSFVAGNFGGITRDLMIGAVPPAAIGDWRYLSVSLVAGAVTFYWFPAIDRLRSPVLVFDGAGLALFAVSGTQKALAFGLNPVMSALLGMLTGIGGGMVRDVLVAEIPTVLRADLYAVAALAGAAVVVIGSLLDLPSTAAMIVGAALCFGLRVMAIQRSWSLPIARPRKQSEAGQAAKARDNDDLRQEVGSRPGAFGRPWADSSLDIEARRRSTSWPGGCARANLQPHASLLAHGSSGA